MVQEFNLEKVKLPSKGGVDISYNIISEDQTNERHYKVKTKEQPHDDLTQAIASLKPYFCKVMGLENLVGQASGGEANAVANSLSVFYDRVEIVSVSMPTKSEVVITADVITDNASTAAMVTPKIFLLLDYFGCEKEIASIVATISVECEALLFKGKQAGATLFDDFLKVV